MRGRLGRRGQATRGPEVFLRIQALFWVTGLVGEFWDENDIIWFAFLKGYSGCCVENGLNGSRVAVGSRNRRYCSNPEKRT